MSSRNWTIGTICILAIAAFTAPAQAGEEKGSGTVTYAPAKVTTEKLTDGSMMQRSHIMGIVLADDPSNSIHLASQDCFGTTLIAADGSANGHGYCDAVDADGDRWWIWWNNTPESNRWGFIGGTGKYEGIKGGGTTAPLTQMADGRTAITWNGTWTMK
jgi:hypothetical protein